MNEQEMRRGVIDLVLWTSPDKLRNIWAFVSSYLHDEKIGIHADAEFLIEYGKFLESLEKRHQKQIEKR